MYCTIEIERLLVSMCVSEGTGRSGHHTCVAPDNTYSHCADMCVCMWSI